MSNKYRSKPVVIYAAQARRYETQAVEALCGDSVVFYKDNLPEEPTEPLGEVYDKLHGVWIPFFERDYIIEGTKGEFYPCREEVFNVKYEVVM